MDTVQHEVQSFTRKVGAADREKLDEYFSSIRDIEQRIQLGAHGPRRLHIVLVDEEVAADAPRPG